MLFLLLVAVAARSEGSPAPRSARGGVAGPSVFTAGTPELVAALLPLRPIVGSWAEYRIRSRGEQDVRVRLSVLPPPVDAGRAWIEVTALGELALPFAARLLVRSGGRLERAVLYVLGQAPIELPLDRAARPEELRKSPPRPILVGLSQMSVPAGRFDCEEVRVVARNQTVRVWRAGGVPLWGLVRAEGPRQIVELIAFAHEGARSVFPDGQGKGSESAK